MTNSLSRIRRRWLVMPSLIAGVVLGVNHEPRPQSDDALIYAVVLRDLLHPAPFQRPMRFVSEFAEPVIDPTIISYRPPPSYDDVMPAAQASTRAAWLRVYNDTTSLADVLPHARVWRVSEIRHGPRSWMRVLMVSPLYSFSRIGYNADRTQAMVYAGYRCDGMCGDGQIVLLEKRDGRWRIVKVELIWIS